jgi:hypothetical protein
MSSTQLITENAHFRPPRQAKATESIQAETGALEYVVDITKDAKVRQDRLRDRATTHQ